MFARRFTLALVLVAGSAFAQTVPTRVTFTGRIVESGAPVTGTRDFVFKLFPTIMGGSEVWLETRNSVAVADGAVNLDLGASTPLTPAILDGQTLYLEVTVGTQVLTPRTPVLSVPYAVRSSVAAQVGSLTAAQIQQRVNSGCGAGAAIQTINADGTVVCQAVGANDAGVTTITNITAGSGLTGGGSTGNVNLAANFGGSGSATTVSRSDHTHAGTYLPLGPVLACGGTDKVVSIAANGSVVCGPDASTTYGVVSNSGLALNGSNQFSLRSCSASEVLVAGAGGTWSCASPAVGVTSVSATANGGVVIGGTATSPTIGLPLACMNGQVMKFNGTAWSCQNEAPELHLGDVIAVGAATNGGLTTGGTTANPTLGLTTCSAGQVMKFNAGGWGCAADGDTDTMSPSLNPFSSAAVAFTEAGWRVEITPSPYTVQVTWLGGFVSYNVDNGDGSPVSGLASSAGSFGKAVPTVGRVVRIDVSANSTGVGTWYHYECKLVFSSIFQCRRRVY